MHARTVVVQFRDLGRRSGFGNEYLDPMAELLTHVEQCEGGVSAGGDHQTRRGHLLGQRAIEQAPGLERSGVLQQFELQNQRCVDTERP